VENHPKLCGKACLEFRDRLNGSFEIAMGLETIHPEALPKLNKQITPDDFKQAAAYLNRHGIDVRAFVLLNPPYLTGKEENIRWTLSTVQFAFESGAHCSSIIPVRPGNGVMELLYQEGHYTPPDLDSLEETFDRALSLQRGRVFVDTWDLTFLSHCPHCFEARKQRLEKMNTDQQLHPRITCNHHSNHARKSPSL
jgi:radical SAM enzyme (TIGR01210 family)